VSGRWASWHLRSCASGANRPVAQDRAEQLADLFWMASKSKRADSEVEKDGCMRRSAG